jgi:hypothetical protein
MKKFKKAVIIITPFLFYWVGFLVVLFFALLLAKSEIGKTIDIPGYIFFFLLFIYPFLFFIPITLSKVKKVVNNLLLTLIFLVMPYIFIYIYVYNALRDAFGHISW